MYRFFFFFILLALSIFTSCSSGISSRRVFQLEDNWQFINREIPGAEIPGTETAGWKTVSVPHDWAISGKFDETIDAQETMVIEDGERVPKMRTGRTGGLPHIGVGWYRKMIDIPKAFRNKRIHIEFDGAMSHAKIYLNGQYVGEWPYGYASFGFDLTDKVIVGEENLLAVRLENKPFSSRWYPGAGIYRNVRLVVTDPVHVKQWGTYITTPDIEKGIGTVKLTSSIVNTTGISRELDVVTEIKSSNGTVVAQSKNNVSPIDEISLEQEMTVEEPRLWSVESPVLYTAVTRIMDNNRELDRYETRFGFRSFEFTNDNGFYLNGKRVQLNGVCLHHDLGPLGAAVNTSSLRHRMKLLQEMGCNSIRTSHNPPAPELLDLADEMGFIVLDEIFDEWKNGKTENGYNKLWDEWAEKDMVAFIHRDRNHPSVVAWSIGNEIREQGQKDGAEICRFLVDICHREDPTRPTTAGFNNWKSAIKNGLAETVDLPAWNYKPQYYEAIHKEHPEWKMYASETASTVSSRGEYFFPAEEKVHFTRDPFHSSSFDNEFPRWATSPDREFAAQDSYKYMAGEYVWTGFDYLGEPTPYNIEWPSRSSYFGIIDLCGIPKDRYYLYQSKWSDKEVLHLLPHWNWEPGQMVSVHCYTSFDKGELFLNGKSLGVREKNPSDLYTTYRLVWDDIVFQPGEIKVVALDKDDNPLKEANVQTAGKPAKIILNSDRMKIAADGKELAFVTVSVLDENGVLCPRADNLVHFTVEGYGNLKAVGNGDPTSLESFVEPLRKTFNGKCMAIVQSTYSPGSLTLKAESEGLQSAEIAIETTK